MWWRRRIGLLLSYATTRVQSSDPFGCCSPFFVSGLEPDWINGAYSYRGFYDAYSYDDSLRLEVGYYSDKNDGSYMYNIDFGFAFDLTNGVKGWAFDPGAGDNAWSYIKCISGGVEVDCPGSCPDEIDEFGITDSAGASMEPPPAGGMGRLLSVGKNGVEGVAISCNAPASNVDGDQSTVNGDPHLSLAHGGTADEHVRSVPTRVYAVVAHSLSPGTYVAQRTHPDVGTGMASLVLATWPAHRLCAHGHVLE